VAICHKSVRNHDGDGNCEPVIEKGEGHLSQNTRGSGDTLLSVSC